MQRIVQPTKSEAQANQPATIVPWHSPMIGTTERCRFKLQCDYLSQGKEIIACQDNITNTIEVSLYNIIIVFPLVILFKTHQKARKRRHHMAGTLYDLPAC